MCIIASSPAIGVGTAVLGITTDQRGIARPSTPDVGAYQTVLGTSTTLTPIAKFTGISVPNTGFRRN